MPFGAGRQHWGSFIQDSQAVFGAAGNLGKGKALLCSAQGGLGRTFLQKQADTGAAAARHKGAGSKLAQKLQRLRDAGAQGHCGPLQAVGHGAEKGIKIAQSERLPAAGQAPVRTANFIVLLVGLRRADPLLGLHHEKAARQVVGKGT